MSQTKLKLGDRLKHILDAHEDRSRRYLDLLRELEQARALINDKFGHRDGYPPPDKQPVTRDPADEARDLRIELEKLREECNRLRGDSALLDWVELQVARVYRTAWPCVAKDGIEEGWEFEVLIRGYGGRRYTYRNESLRQSLAKAKAQMEKPCPFTGKP